MVGPVAEINRRWIDWQAAIGGFDVVQISEALNINFPSCNTANTGTLILSPDQSCGQLIGFKEIPSSKGDVEFNLFPNPTSGKFTIEGNFDVPATFELFDITGRAVLTQSINSSQPINISHLAKGLYVCKIGSERGKLILE